MNLKKTVIIKRHTRDPKLTRGVEFLIDEAHESTIIFLPPDATVEFAGEDSKVVFARAEREDDNG